MNYQQNAFDQPVALAEELIHAVANPNHLPDKHKRLVGAAHYSLAFNHDYASARRRLHLNNAIAILQQVQHFDEPWANEITLAYFKRAEIAEEQGNVVAALYDYQKIIDILETVEARDDNQRMLLAQSYLALADLGFMELAINSADQAYFHAQLAIDELQAIEEKDDEVWHSLSHTYYTAAIALTEDNPDKVLSLVKQALHYAYMTDGRLSSPVLVDIYRFLNTYYIERSNLADTAWETLHFDYAARVYSDLTTFFHFDEDTFFEHAFHALESLIELPILMMRFKGASLPEAVIRDFIDAMIYIYYCLGDQSLPIIPYQQMSLDESFFKQHAENIKSLLIYYSQHYHHEHHLLKRVQYHESDYAKMALEVLQKTKCKVYYLTERHANVAPVPL